MKYRIKRVGTGKYYAEWSRFGLFWRTCYVDENLLIESWRPHAYGTFQEAVKACDAFEALRRGKKDEPVEITLLDRRYPQ